MGNTGAEMPHWWWGKLVIDLETMKSNREKKPVLLDHRTDQPVGYSEKLELNNDGFVIEGVFVENEFSAQVQNLLSQGFPYEASIGIEVGEFERLSDGEFATVNGRRFDGPGVVARHSTYREVSFVVLGADQDTSAEQLSKKNDTQVEVTVMRSPSSKGDEDMDLEKLKQEHPELVTQLHAEGASGARAEVQRLLALATSEQVPLIKECLKEGLSFEQSAERLALDSKRRLEAAAKSSAEQSAQSAEAAAIQSRQEQRREELQSLGPNSSTADGTERTNLEAMWDAMSDVQRGEHFDDFESFAAEMKSRRAQKALAKFEEGING